MAPTAGFSGKLAVTSTATTAISSDYIAGAKNVQFKRGRQLLDVTSFKNVGSQGERQQLAALKDIDLSFDCDFEPGDTPTGLILSAYDSGGDVYMHVLYNGTNGWRTPMKVES